MNLALLLAWRFRNSKQLKGFTSFISASSTIGVGLGCFVLIVLLSLMNGFEKELKDRLLSVIPHGELWAVSPDGLEDWSSLTASILQDPSVVSVEPYAKATGMLQFKRDLKAIEVVGLSPEYSQNNALSALIEKDVWARFESDAQGIILGEGVSEKLGIEVGERVKLLLPQASDDLSLKPPKTVWLTVSGIISIGGELDNHLAFMRLKKAADVMGIAQGAHGIRLRYHDPFMAQFKTRKFGQNVMQHLYMSDWTRTQGHLYQDIQLVRLVVYIALTLVIAVASFNIVSTLVLSVNEKQGEIAMLKTMGASNTLITMVFVIQGLINGIVGMVFGVLSGVLVASNLSDIAVAIEEMIGAKILSGDIYFINFLPSVVRVEEVVFTATIAMILTILATIYPARRAAKIEPASALNH